MRKHLLSFDKFHEQKSIEYVKLVNQAVLSRSKTSGKNRFLHRKCPTQGFDDNMKLELQSSKGQTHFLTSFLSFTQKPHDSRKHLGLDKRLEKTFENNRRLALNPEHEENIFSNDYVRERLRIARIQQCKVKEIVFKNNQNFEALECLNNSKAFKIRSRKFQYFGETVKNKRNNSEVELLGRGPIEDGQICVESRTVQL